MPSDADVTVIGGAGHVGLPLALSFIKEGQKVVIHDINRDALQTIADGKLPYMEYQAQPLLKEALESGRLFLNDEILNIPPAGGIIIAVGTPVDEFLNPVQKAIKSCLDGLIPYLSPEHLVILRSTVYPGTTEWVDRYLKSKGVNTDVAYCPERVTQGHSIIELREIPHIISGTSDKAIKRAEMLFSLLSPDIVRMEPMEAEFAKLFTNAYRYIHFAISNEFFMIADEAGLNFNKILDGMTKNYPRAKYIPSPGFTSGPCLFKDTAQLVAFAKNKFNLGNAAINVNEGIVLNIVENMRKKYDLSNLTVGILGMAFKADVDDIRSSLSYKIKNLLDLYAAKVLSTDPYVHTDPDILPLNQVIENSDVLVLCTPHSQYRDLDTAGKTVIDIWGFLNSSQT